MRVKEWSRLPTKKPEKKPPMPTGPAAPVFYTGREVAVVMSVPYDTVEYWRRTGTMTGPLGLLVGRRVLYPRADVHKLIDELIEEQERQRTGAA
jgi:hypothetical protein